MDRDFVAAVEEDERSVASVLTRHGLDRAGLLGEDAKRLRRVYESAAAREDVGERVTRPLDDERFAPARRNRNIEVARLGGDAVHGSLLAPEVATDHAHASAIVVDHFRDVPRRDVLISGRRHLEGRRKVRPELKPVHAPERVAARHLLVEDAAARGHPLHVARAE